MPIEQDLARIAIAVEAIAAHLTGNPVPVAEPEKKAAGRPPGAPNKPKPEAAAAKPEVLGSAAATTAAKPAAAATSEYTTPMVSAKITSLIAMGKRDEALALIAECGGTKASTIPPANYPAFFAGAAKIEQGDADPAA